jgi:hypothetical protein
MGKDVKSFAEMDADRRAMDSEMIRSPSEWPCFPVLPVKRYDDKKPGGFPTVAVLLAETLKVYNANLYMLPDNKEDWEKVLIREYDCAEDVVADGWMVD